MRVYRWSATLAVLAAFLMLSGCGTKGTGAADAKLPAWVPESPSPEFVRAAETLKPLADEASTDPSKQAEQTRFHQILVPAWEFFGTLSDDQVKGLLADKRVSMSCASLTQQQREALDSFFKVYRSAMKDAPVSDDWPVDLLADLRRFGASEDLSNLELVLNVREGNRVCLMCLIRLPNGSATKLMPLAGLGTI